MTTPVIAAVAACSDTFGEFIPGDDSPIAPKFRFQFNDPVTPSSAAGDAAQRCLAQVGWTAADLDFVISCTATPDFNNPGLVSFLLDHLGRKGIPGLELKLLSAGPIYAIDLAARLIQLGRASRVLVTGVDLLSRYFRSGERGDPAAEAARSVSADGAAACLVCASSVAPPGSWKISPAELASFDQGQRGFYCELPCSGRLPQRIIPGDLVEGRHLPRLEFERVLDDLRQYGPQWSAQLETTAELICAHANFGGMSSAVTQALKLQDRALNDCFPDRGYTGAAGLLTALAAAEPTSNSVLLLAAEAGVSFAAITLRRVG